MSNREDGVYRPICFANVFVAFAMRDILHRRGKLVNEPFGSHGSPVTISDHFCGTVHENAETAHMTERMTDIIVPHRPEFHAKKRVNAGVLLTAALVLFIAPGLTGASTAEESRRVIVVSGEGQVSATPDQARLSAGVVTQDQTAADALDAN